MKISNLNRERERILVLGAAGKTGYATARELLVRGELVRAFVHRKSDRSDALMAAGAEIFVGDMSDFEDISKSLTGIDKAYFVAPWVPEQLHIATTFAAAAAESGLKLIVAITQWLAQPRHPSLATRQAFLSDRLFGILPGIDVVTINTGWFADNFLQPELLAMATQLGIFPFPLWEGRTAPVSNEDLGRVAAEALVNPQPYIGRMLRPTGPELMSPQELADALGRAAGRKVRFNNISDRQFQKAMQFMAMPVHMQAQVRRYVEEYRRGSFEMGAPNDVVLEMTGKAAEDFESIARRYINSYAPITVPTLGNKLKAIGSFIRLALTSPVDLDKFEKSRDYPLPVNPAYSIESTSWVQSHDKQHKGKRPPYNVMHSSA
ncbi:MAG: NmrA family NAD(P)-binding protein [Candidatus Thiodiazotropha sp.]|nr:NmrA family NAD(P)-binding protein [Candidatus Thiodiazotropha taylori]MBT3058010.1 NmrA family NAD(P)-binding protein [Candidatus Thiodiazotropha sp. (ex Lucina pensylvanica)]MBT3064778.1 NmrA family NAD(P)-binding protein [Candidatus Thiodiazotropha sp. (ex Lucina pensylvanica)]MBV2096898.1 NmrA family NAD(P)-binding protein [Candidatus Thiodiazotropha sp. (ex Codakia orbicularis)]PUB77162.1 MAG: NmrA family transcriptional regulator [gamma proteobacterium symbiont of Ctena orbiculata]